MTSFMFGRGKGLFCLLVWVTCALMANSAHATHFRYGTISWQPVAGETNTIEFTIQSGWRRSSYSTALGRCIDPATLLSTPCSEPDGFAGVNDVIVEFQGGTTFDPGDGSGLIGSTLGPLLYLVSQIDPATDSLMVSICHRQARRRCRRCCSMP